MKSNFALMLAGFLFFNVRKLGTDQFHPFVGELIPGLWTFLLVMKLI
jgi:hypothetical protein